MRVDLVTVSGLGVAVAFLLDWVAVWFDWKSLKPFTKPLAMLTVIFWTVLNTQQFSPAVGLLIAAQACGLLGDILLLFPQKAFSHGLGAFLAGHVIYIGLLISTLPAMF